ncbi:MAG: DUF4276 family protein [Bacteroidales bacterium]|nr:DUF4276 family protein [Bacteroidales bacterium]
MNTVILNILCEGHTEERFVKDVFKPYLQGDGIVVKSRLLVTSRKKDASGGLVSYQQAKRDLELWMREVFHRNSETHYFTTMFDLYALRDDFPEAVQSKSILDVYAKVENIENAFGADINSPNFIPYIQLHEFEALLFCDIEKLAIEYPRCTKEIEKLKEILHSYNDNPELIDNSPETAPSKRIIKAIEGSGLYKYNKPRSGATVAAAIGMPELLNHCLHFRKWIEKIRQTLDS